MKLNLMLGNHDDIYNGYINISPFVAPNSKDVVPGDLTNLDNLVEPNECSEILALDVLEYYPRTQIDKIVQHWCSKLRYNGTLSIGGHDINLIAKKIYHRDMDFVQTQEILYGRQQNQMQFKLHISNLYHLINLMERCGLKIIEKTILDNQFSFIIKGLRCKN